MISEALCCYIAVLYCLCRMLFSVGNRFLLNPSDQQLLCQPTGSLHTLKPLQQTISEQICAGSTSGSARSTQFVLLTDQKRWTRHSHGSPMLKVIYLLYSDLHDLETMESNSSIGRQMLRGRSTCSISDLPDLEH